MLLRTHLAINLFFGLFFASYIEHKTIFIALVLLATMLPDIDILNSYISKKARLLSRIVNFFSKHRGFFHSLTCSFIFSILFIFISTAISLPFFIGYSMHIIADSFTVQGIEPFWPLKKKLKGKIRTNGLTEKIIFFVFLVVDLFYLAYLF